MECLSIIGLIRMSEEAAQRFLEEQLDPFQSEVRALLRRERRGDVCLLQYDVPTHSLFYCHWLGVRSLRALQEQPCFHAMREIKRHKDNDQPDFLVMSSSAPNLLTDPLLAAYRIEAGLCTEVQVEEVPRQELEAMEELSIKYLYNVASGSRVDGTPLELEDDEGSGAYSMFIRGGSIHPHLVDSVRAGRKG